MWIVDEEATAHMCDQLFELGRTWRTWTMYRSEVEKYFVTLRSFFGYSNHVFMPGLRLNDSLFSRRRLYSLWARTKSFIITGQLFCWIKSAARFSMFSAALGFSLSKPLFQYYLLDAYTKFDCFPIPDWVITYGRGWGKRDVKLRNNRVGFRTEL